MKYLIYIIMLILIGCSQPIGVANKKPIKKISPILELASGAKEFSGPILKYTATFSREVKGLLADHIETNGGTVTNFKTRNNIVYTFSVEGEHPHGAVIWAIILDNNVSKSSNIFVTTIDAILPNKITNASITASWKIPRPHFTEREDIATITFDYDPLEDDKEETLVEVGFLKRRSLWGLQQREYLTKSVKKGTGITIEVDNLSFGTLEVSSLNPQFYVTITTIDKAKNKNISILYGDNFEWLGKLWPRGKGDLGAVWIAPPPPKP